MKTKILFSALVSFIFYLSSAQVPQGFNYQAIARDVSGNPIVSQTLQVELSIQSDTSVTPAVVWKERFSIVKTNAFGLFTVVLGTGVRQTGSSATTFPDVNWSVPQLFIRTQIYYQGVWKPMGQAKLWSVPYAMVSGNLSGPVKKLAISSLNLSPDSAIFEVKNNTGQTIFAVYNEGVRVYVDNGAKGNRGGFAIGGFGSAKAPSQDLMMISPDSARVYVGASKGGFAVNGYGSGTNPKQNLMLISPDSARIYVKESVAKGTRGGFAIGGFNPAKGTVKEFMIMTPKNYFIGHNSGQLISSLGIYNSTLGYESGKSLVDGSNNVFIGYQSGLTTSNGGSNVFIGTQAGYLNSAGSYNILLGRLAGYNNTASSNIFMGDLTGNFNTTGSQNVFIGDWAGYRNTLGLQNVFLGAEAGWYNVNGSYNNFMGFESGYRNTAGSYNSFIGYKSGFNNTTGQFNTYLGYQAGYSGVSASGSNNIFMGVEAGYSNTSGHDNIAIGNKAGRSVLDGIYNVMIGSDAGNLNTSGDYNTLLGYKSGEKHIGDYATLVGYLAGNSTTSGNSQTMLGYMAGSSNIGSYNTFLGTLAGDLSSTGNFNTYVGLASGREATGSFNVFLGRWAGWYETGSNKLIVETIYNGADNYNNALVYGDFATKYLRVNGQILNSVNKASGWAADFKNTGGLSSSYGLNISAGSADGSGLYNYLIDFNSGNGAWKGSIMIKDGAVSLYSISDSRQKENISKSGLNALKIIDSLQVMEYNFTKSPGTKHTGYIAQDVQKVLPEMVMYNEKADAYAISTATLIPVLHKAIQEQQKMIELQAKKIEELEKAVKLLMNK
jgi:hypothetical protein